MDATDVNAGASALGGDAELERLRRLAADVAYRMLGSVAEAEDVAQEALLRLHAAPGANGPDANAPGANAPDAPDAVRNPDAFLTTVATRLSLDVLRSARVRREAYVGEWLPEPLVEDLAPQRVEADETISLAFLALLERLAPEERAALVLREAFDYGYEEIGAVLGKRPDACRQLVSRARRRVDDERPRFDPDPAERDALAARFLAAARDGDLDGLVALLAPDAVLVGDGGGKALSISRPLTGAPAIAKALVSFARIVRVHSMLNPDKLGHLGPLSGLALRRSRGDA